MCIRDRPRAQLEARSEAARRVDVRVAVDRAEAQELGAQEARDRAEDALLLGVRQAGLEADEVVRGQVSVLGPQLHDRPRPVPGPGTVSYTHLTLPTSDLV